jgi:hypothetical protein
VTSRAELLLDKGNKEELNLKNLEIVHAQVPSGEKKNGEKK